jgi:hypothetical protein
MDNKKSNKKLACAWNFEKLWRQTHFTRRMWHAIPSIKSSLQSELCKVPISLRASLVDSSLSVHCARWETIWIYWAVLSTRIARVKRRETTANLVISLNPMRDGHFGLAFLKGSASALPAWFYPRKWVALCGGGRVESQRRQIGTTHVNIVISSTTIVSFSPSRFVGTREPSTFSACASSTSNILNAENASAVGDTCLVVMSARASTFIRRYFHPKRIIIEVMKRTHSRGALHLFALVCACYSFVCFRWVRKIQWHWLMACLLLLINAFWKAHPFSPMLTCVIHSHYIVVSTLIKIIIFHLFKCRLCWFLPGIIPRVYVYQQV